MNPRLIFMHLPKCGGTTFNHLLERIYRKEDIFFIKEVSGQKLNTEEFISLPPSKRQQLSLLDIPAKVNT